MRSIHLEASPELVAPRPKRLSSRTCVACALVGALWLAAPTALVAQETVPECRGVDPAAAATAIEAGDAAVARATQLASRGRSAGAQSVFAEALASYDRACAAGADLALERRAIPLARLGRSLDAVRSLDAFLAAHPLDTLPEADRARIESNRRSLERQVVTLAVASQPEATVLVNGREIGQTPILHHRLAAGGEIELTLRAPGHLDRVQQVTLEAGVAQRIVVQLSPIPAPAEPVVEPVEVEPVAQEQANEPVEDSPSAESPTRARPDTAPIATRSEAERTPSQAMDRTPWVVVAGVVAAAGLGAGIGGVVLMSDRRSAMEGACFGLVPDVIPGCDAIRSEYDLGTGLAIGGFALAAIAGTAAVLIAVIPSGDEDPGSRTSLSCGLGLSGLACQGTF